MGLLDEAIREHLELKRRRGADPTEVAREERDALEPVFPDEESAGDGEPADAGADPVSEEAVPTEAQPEPPKLSTVGQETAEIDMQAVLEEDAEPAGAPPAGPPFAERPMADAHAGEHTEEDSLEWEVPGEGVREPVPEDVPGQERLSFD